MREGLELEPRILWCGRPTGIINAGTDDAKYMINVKHVGKFVVGLGDQVAPTDIDEAANGSHWSGLQGGSHPCPPPPPIYSPPPNHHYTQSRHTFVV